MKAIYKIGEIWCLSFSIKHFIFWLYSIMKKINKEQLQEWLYHFKKWSKIYKLAHMLLTNDYITLPQIMLLWIWSPATQISKIRKTIWFMYSIENIQFVSKKTKEKHSFYFVVDRSLSQKEYVTVISQYVDKFYKITNK